MTFLRWVDECLMLNKAVSLAKHNHRGWSHFGYAPYKNCPENDRLPRSVKEEHGLAVTYGCNVYCTTRRAPEVLAAMKSRYIRIASDKRIDDL